MNELNLNKKGMTSLEIAKVIGKQHAHVMRDIRNLLSQGVAESNFGLSEYKDVTGRTLPCFNLTPKGCLILASGYDAVLREKIINRLESLETGQASPLYKEEQHELSTSDKALVVELAMRVLNLNDASKVKLIRDNFPGVALPDYVPSKGILKSATALLKEQGKSVSARVFNLAAVDAGYLKEVDRKSSKGTIKKYKAITDQGLEFGENQVSPENPKETQPMWYEDSFGVLLEKLGI